MLKFYFSMNSLRRGGWCVYSSIPPVPCEFVAGPFNSTSEANAHWIQLEKDLEEDEAEYNELIAKLAKQAKQGKN
jgi:hypothetical protein